MGYVLFGCIVGLLIVVAVTRMERTPRRRSWLDHDGGDSGGSDSGGGGNG